MALTSPLNARLVAQAPPVGTAGNDAAVPVAISPFAGVVSGVAYVPAGDITGAATNNRRLRLVNKGSDGDGTAIVAELQFTNGTDAAGMAAAALTLSGTAANLDVDAGDVLAWESTHIGTGITDPGGIVRVTVSRA